MRSTLLSTILVTLLAAGCSMPGPVAGLSTPNGSHGGWGVDRPASAADSARADDEPVAPAQASEIPQAVAEARPEVESPPEPRRETAPRTPERVIETSPAPAQEIAEPGPSAPSGAVVNRVSVAERSDGRGLVVRVHTSGHVPAYRVEEGADGEVSLVLFQTEVNASGSTNPQGPIQSIRVEQNGTRAAVRLAIDPNVSVVPQAYPDRDSDDLLLALTFMQRPTITSPPVAAATNAPSNGSGNNGEHWRLDCIVIDPGHGGRDPGAVNTSLNIRESDVALGISLRLGRMIEERLGVRVVYTRNDDRFVELEERGRIANQSCGKLFVSIHGNSASNRSAQGTETYFLGMHRTESARRVMERENSVIALESDPSLYSGMDEAALIMQTMAQATYLRISEQLASLVENQFESHASRRSRGVKQAGFLVLWGASMPAVLVETGFISNNEEARFLNSAAGQEQIAESIYRAIREYKAQYERSLGVAVN